MLLSRLLTWFRRRLTLHVFLLEIAAIFIGISASLIVDDWRQEHETTERLNYLLEEIHFSLVLDRASNRAEYLLNAAAIESALVLAYEDTSAIDDDTLLRHFVLASPPPSQTTLPPGYGRVTGSALAMPFDRTLASIDGDFRELEKAIATLNISAAQIRELVTQLLRATSRPADTRRVGLDGLSSAAAGQVSELFSLLSASEGYLRDLDDAASARHALGDPAVHAILVELVSRRADAGVQLIQTNARINSLIATIRSYAPDIALPIEVVGIDGTATGLGWSDTDNAEKVSLTIPLQRKSADPNVWSAIVDLVDGELKFRADDSWVLNWGVPREARNLTGTGAQFDFGGNADDYFPSGVAEIRGINIPVRKGRYHVVFNSQTFAYRFDTVQTDVHL